MESVAAESPEAFHRPVTFDSESKHSTSRERNLCDESLDL